MIGESALSKKNCVPYGMEQVLAVAVDIGRSYEPKP